MKRIKQGLLDMMNMSEGELPQNIEITDLLYKPTSLFYKENILEVEYIGWKKSPNVYVIKTNEVIFVSSEKTIKSLIFSHEGLNYLLEDVLVMVKNGLFYLECRKWKEELID
jgi:hypothetical protein